MPRLALTARTLRVLAADTINDEGLQWIELMPTAEKARNGPWYFTVTRDDLETYAASIRDLAEQDPIPVDYDHEGDEGGSTRAAGWFTGQAKVEERDGGPRLMAEVRWTPKAAQEIRDGEYRRVSPVFSFEEHDKKTGLMTGAKRIIAATLTNRPFFRELAPVGADVVWSPTDGFERVRERLYAELNPGGPEYARFWVMDIAPGRALVAEYQESRHWVVPFEVSGDDLKVAEQSEWTPAVQEWVEAARAALAAGTRQRPFIRTSEGEPMDPKILKALGLAEDADEKTVTAKVAELTGQVGEVEALKAKVAELEAGKPADGEEDRVAKLEAALAAERTLRVTGEREQLLAQAVREGRIFPAQKESLIAGFGGTAPDDEAVKALKSFLDAAPADTVTLKERGSGLEKPEGETAPPEAKAQFEERHLGKDGQVIRAVAASDESVDLHVKAEKHLRDAGKTTWTEDEYLAAVIAVR